MQGNAKVLETLADLLASELSAASTYFVHSKMRDNWGYPDLAKRAYDDSIDEMRHAEKLTDRILFLDGLPNFQRLFPLRIGQTPQQMFEADLAVEVEAIDRLRRGAEYMRSVSDITSAKLFETILADEETHVDYLETQLALLEKLGEPLFISGLIEQPA